MKLNILIILLMASSFAFSQKTKNQLTDLEKEIILDEHNKYRTEVGNDSLIWSDDLAKIAQQWADKLARTCTMVHSSGDYGENIYWNSAEANPVAVVKLWADEKQFYNGEELNEKNYAKFGHYTQLVWYNTTEVGCAKAKCKDGGEIWVCNYNPPGNYIGEKAYNND